MFQVMAASKAAMATGMVTACSATTSFPMVVATATPNRNGPIKLDIAVIANAHLGDMAREAMAVATTLALSWKPFKKSKINAIATKMINVKFNDELTYKCILSRSVTFKSTRLYPAAYIFGSY